MKKAIRYGIIGIFVYVIFMLYMGKKNPYFSYSEIDDNNDGFVSLGELLWYSDVGTRIEYSKDTNNSSKEKCVFEVFALKDGLTLKEFPMDCNSTVYPVPPSKYHYDNR